MNIKSALDCERRQLEKLKNYQLPNYFKRIGLGIAAVCFISVFVNKFTVDSEFWKAFLKYGITFGLLITSISKEKIEDEFITKLRMTSYSFAFIFAVLYSYANPVIIYAVEYLTGNESVVFEENGDFVILWTLLSVQLALFHLFKKTA